MTESVGPTPIIADSHVDSRAHTAFGLTDVLLLAMAAIWGINFVVVKYATHIFNPIAFTGLRVVTAAIFLLIAAFGRGRTTPGSAENIHTRMLGTALNRADVIRLLLLGALGNGLYQLFFVHGVARTRAGNASLIVGAAPAFIALFARVRGLERAKRTTLLGIGLSVIGVALVIAGSAGAARGEATLLGSLLVFFGVMCWTFYTILLQPYTKRVDVLSLSAITMLGGAVPLLVISTPALVVTSWSSIGIGGWLALLYSSVISMGVAYIFWYRGRRGLGPTRTSVYSNLQPIN